MRSKNLILSFLLSLSLFGCAAAELPRNVPPGERDPVTVEAKFAGSEIGAQNVVEVKFPRSSALLSEKVQTDIVKALEKARVAGNLREIKIAAWPDRDSAQIGGKSLSEEDQKLAERRLAAVRTALGRRVEDRLVERHNMAVSPGALDRLFSTSEYRLKDSLRAAGVAEENRQSGTTSMAGRAVMMLIVGPRKEK